MLSLLRQIKFWLYRKLFKIPHYEEIAELWEYSHKNVKLSHSGTVFMRHYLEHKNLFIASSAARINRERGRQILLKVHRNLSS